MKLKILIMFLLFSSVVGQAKKIPYTYTTATKKFDFTINFWVNMHHFLYHETHAQLNRNTSLLSNELLQNLNPEEVAVLEATLTFYKDEIHAKHFFYSEYMNTVLSHLKNSKKKLKVPRNPELAPLLWQLKKFKRVYFKHFWERHYTQNKTILQQNLESVKTIEVPIATNLSTLFKKEWQANKIKVDVSAYGGLNPSSHRNIPYSIVNPTHVIMISSDYLLQNNALWLELLFHEASHHLVFYNQGFIADTIIKTSQEIGVQAHRGLWHAYLFYIVGKVTKKTLEKHSITSYQTYMEKFAVFSGIYPSLEKLDFYIDHKKSLKKVTKEILEEIKT